MDGENRENRLQRTFVHGLIFLVFWAALLKMPMPDFVRFIISLGLLLGGLAEGAWLTIPHHPVYHYASRPSLFSGFYGLVTAALGFFIGIAFILGGGSLILILNAILLFLFIVFSLFSTFGLVR